MFCLTLSRSYLFLGVKFCHALFSFFFFALSTSFPFCTLISPVLVRIRTSCSSLFGQSPSFLLVPLLFFFPVYHCPDFVVRRERKIERRKIDANRPGQGHPKTSFRRERDDDDDDTRVNLIWPSVLRSTA